MDITRRCDYACRILRAAYRSKDAYVSVSGIAEAEDIPYAFARSIQHDLVKAGLIKTVRGARGGLMLACDPAEITMLDILEALQGPVSISACRTTFFPRSNGTPRAVPEWQHSRKSSISRILSSRRATFLVYRMSERLLLQI